MSVAVRRTDLGGLLARRHDWDALLRLQPLPDPTRSAGWLAAWWNAYGAPRRGRGPVVLLVEEDSALVGGLALMTERLPGGLTLLRHLGSSSHWFDPSPLIRPRRDDALRALGRAIAGEPVDLVVLEDLVEGSSTLATLLAAVPGATAALQGERRHRLRMARPPDLRRRRKENRRMIRRARERVRLDIRVLDRREDVLRAADDAVALVARAWSGRGDASEITGRAGHEYLRTALHSLPPGRTAMTQVVADGELVAFDLALREGPLAVVFRGNWDPCGGVSGAGWMSMLALLDHLEAAGAEVVDVGKFAWAYKRRLASPPSEPLATLQAGRGVGGAAAGLLWRSRPMLLAARARVRASFAVGLPGG